MAYSYDQLSIEEFEFRLLLIEPANNAHDPVCVSLNRVFLHSKPEFTLGDDHGNSRLMKGDTPDPRKRSKLMKSFCDYAGTSLALYKAFESLGNPMVSDGSMLYVLIRRVQQSAATKWRK